MTWETVIGLEVHAQLNTNSKLFSNAPTQYGQAPNTQVNILDAGFPGTLPVLNEKALYLAVQFGLAIQGKINQLSYFERKNYFYPDLPKGYQISQFRRPIVSDGHLLLPSGLKVTIVRAHLEEDAGKSTHTEDHTAIDLNRSGIALLEIVTAPCLSNTEEVIAYLKTLNQLLRFLNVCNGNMQEGSFRCDVNLSLKRLEDKQLGTRVELKNLNSYRFIEKAILFEQQRQANLLNQQQPVLQETRLYHEEKNATFSMRDKENVCDYRYFPDPDLLPIFIDDQILENLLEAAPELPLAIQQRLQKEGITHPDDLDYLMSHPAIFHYYESCKKTTTAPLKLIINWLKGPLTAELKAHQQSFENTQLSTRDFGLLLNAVHEKQITEKIAKDILKEVFSQGSDLANLLSQNSTVSKKFDSQALIEQLKANFPQQIAQYLSGEEKVLAYLMGQAMKLTQGQVDPKTLQHLLRRSLKD